MARKKRTWDQLQTQGIGDSTRTRNVYDDQQVARGHSKLRSKKPGYVIAGVVGVLVAIMAWVIISLVMFAGSWLGSAMGEGQPEYYKEVKTSSVTWCYQPVDAKGNAINSAPCYKDEAEAVDNPPQWYVDYQKTHEGDAAPALSDSFKSMNPWKLFFTLVSGLAVASLISTKFSRSVDAHNTLYTNEDVNEHYNDRHIAVPDEIIRQYEWFPDAGAHCSVEVSSLISHIMLSNKGLKKVDLTQRHTENVLDERGAVEIYKGSPITDDSGNYASKSLPMIDEEFGEDLFTASGVPAGRDGKGLRRRFDPDAVEYGVKPGAKATRKTKTYAEMINADWDLPVYEVQRPAGAYLVDTAPVNTMVLAITRAGKGQTYIEPMLDMWSREKNPNNMVINDPKGELLVKNIVSFTMRGFDVVQFNLINALTTDIYNPLALASQAAREGDAMKCSQYVGNIADVFFPLDGGEDPVWPQAANNAFKRAAYGLIDYYLEEEREQRNHARATNMDPKVLENRLDSMWGKVTLYNCYQLFVQMSSKKMKSPLTVLEQRKDSGAFGNPEGEDFNEEAYDSERAIAELREAVWDGEEERDMLTLYFNATNKLPKSSMREAVANADNSLRSMAGAEKMLASVYGIAITAMSFFTDARISGMTSGTPSQNVDLAGMSFPRRIGVRLNADFVRRDNLVGVQAVWDAFSDENFTTTLGAEFDHEDLMTRDGWARYYFRGIFPQMTAYLRLRLVNPKTNLLIKTFYFKFTKSFKTNLSGRTFIRNQITGEKVIKDGILVELVRKETRTADGVSQVRFEKGNVTFPQEHLVDLDVEGLPVPNKEMQDTPAITQTMVRYSEMPKAVFLVTPPHMMKYAKLILILITQLVNLNFDQSYMTKENQKPLYKTRFMLDELGNLQSEGHGIADFATMLSIGLGQEQQFTIILQTLQQLRDVYGESVDKIVQGNTNNIVFLKSTDDSLIETMQKMSGTRHVTRTDSKSITKDTAQVVKATSVEGKVTYTRQTSEEPVISANDLQFLSERNAIVFSSGKDPVWNRNETIMPMSWRLFQNKIVKPGETYTLQTIPTSSTVKEFDLEANQPDFDKLLDKRVMQAQFAAEATDLYQRGFGYSDFDMEKLDQNVRSAGIMEIVDQRMKSAAEDIPGADDEDFYDPEVLNDHLPSVGQAEEDTSTRNKVAEREARLQDLQRMRYAEGLVSREMLINYDDSPKQGTLDTELVDAYRRCAGDMQRDLSHFQEGTNGGLKSPDGTIYIEAINEAKDVDYLRTSTEDEQRRVYAEDAQSPSSHGWTFRLTPAFYLFLAEQESWKDIAHGEFDRSVALAMRMREEATLDTTNG